MAVKLGQEQQDGRLLGFGRLMQRMTWYMLLITLSLEERFQMKPQEAGLFDFASPE